MKLNQGKIENKNILPPETDQKAQNKKRTHMYSYLYTKYKLFHTTTLNDWMIKS
jgi:hypothetical protein